MFIPKSFFDPFPLSTSLHIEQSYLICISLRAVGIQKFSRTIHRRCFFDGGGAPATPILFSFRIAIAVLFD